MAHRNYNMAFKLKASTAAKGGREQAAAFTLPLSLFKKNPSQFIRHVIHYFAGFQNNMSVKQIAFFSSQY